MLGMPLCCHPRLPTQAQQTATGGSAMKAVEVVMEHGVPEDRIIFINLVRALSLYLHSIFRHDQFGGAQVSAPEGLKTFTSRYPLVKVVGYFFSCFGITG
jgi:hypothetical protein